MTLTKKKTAILFTIAYMQLSENENKDLLKLFTLQSKRILSDMNIEILNNNYISSEVNLYSENVLNSLNREIEYLKNKIDNLEFLKKNKRDSERNIKLLLSDFNIEFDYFNNNNDQWFIKLYESNSVKNFIYFEDDIINYNNTEYKLNTYIRKDSRWIRGFKKHKNGSKYSVNFTQIDNLNTSDINLVKRGRYYNIYNYLNDNLNKLYGDLF